MSFLAHEENGLLIKTSTVLSGVRHGFSTRTGGVSPAPWDSLNLGVGRGDDMDRVRENYRRFCAVLGTDEYRAVLSKQVHEDNVRHVTAEDCGKGLFRERDYTSVDAMITDTPDIPLVVFSADCGIILLYDPVRRAVGAAHAGWRGAAAGIVYKTVRRMQETFGTDPRDLRAASFSDGTSVTARDVVNALRRAQTSARYSGRLAEVSDIWVSNGAVRISLTTDNRSFVSRLDIPIVKSGTESSTFPIGTGPYAYSGEGGAHLAKNASWWQGKALPLDRIELTACKDTDSVSYAFYAREIQLLFCDLTGADTSNVYGSGDYTDAATSIMQYLCLNTRRAPFDDPAVRRAVTLGVDRAGCVSAFLLGHGMAAHFPLSPASDLYPKELETAYSPDGYASALEAAGLHTGKTRSLTLLVNQENSFKVSTAQKIAAGLSQYDLQVTVQALPNEEYLQALQNGDFDLCFCEVKLTADWDLRPLLQSYASLNFGGYADPETDQLLAGLCAAEPAGRAAAMTDLCRKLADQAPIVPVCFKSYSVLLPAGAALQPITPTAANPFCGISDWKLNMK